MYKAHMILHLELAGSHKSSYIHNEHLIEYIVCILLLRSQDPKSAIK